VIVGILPGRLDMKKAPGKRTACAEKKLDFERERILNLIGSRIRRQDTEIAQKLAEDLYKVEIGCALHRVIRKLKRYNKLTFLLFILTFPVLLTSITLTVLGRSPYFYLLVFAAAMIFIILFFFVVALPVRQLKKDIEDIIDSYETRKQNFVICLIERLTESCGNDDAQTSFSLPAIKREMQQWLGV
jgi:hypothetical protein